MAKKKIVVKREKLKPLKKKREISEEAKTLMGRVKKYKATWLFASRNDLKTGGSYGDFGLKISPRASSRPGMKPPF